MNGEVCCILGICCPPEQRTAALAQELVNDGVVGTMAEAHAVAAYIFKHFDLAPAGALLPLVQQVAQHARKP